MNLTPHQIAVRHLATEAEYINRLLRTRDLSRAKARAMLGDAAISAAKSAGEALTIRFGVDAGRAWFTVL